LPDEPEILPLGKGRLEREGKDAVIVAIGNRVYPSLQAAEKLAADGLDTAVINARFVKPLDEELILAWAKKTGHAITVEENAGAGGFGSAVLELLVEKGLHGIKVRSVALPDRFIEHGSQADLRHRVGIDTEGIVAAVKNAVKTD